jgi:hypothetical protein
MRLRSASAGVFAQAKLAPSVEYITAPSVPQSSNVRLFGSSSDPVSLGLMTRAEYERGGSISSAHIAAGMQKHSHSSRRAHVSISIDLMRRILPLRMLPAHTRRRKPALMNENYFE